MTIGTMSLWKLQDIYSYGELEFQPESMRVQNMDVLAEVDLVRTEPISDPLPQNR